MAKAGRSRAIGLYKPQSLHLDCPIQRHPRTYSVFAMAKFMGSAMMRGEGFTEAAALLAFLRF